MEHTKQLGQSGSGGARRLSPQLPHQEVNGTTETIETIETKQHLILPWVGAPPPRTRTRTPPPTPNPLQREASACGGSGEPGDASKKVCHQAGLLTKGPAPGPKTGRARCPPPPPRFGFYRITASASNGR
jgi:hypothetical protein